jgi:prolipoprotein diacylglyceryltransferase
LSYFGETRHPVGLYQAGAALLVTLLLWWRGDVMRPARLLLQAVLSYSLVRLVTDGFLADSAAIGNVRVSQVVALAVALVAVLLLARQSNTATTSELPTQSPPQSAP